MGHDLGETAMLFKALHAFDTYRGLPTNDDIFPMLTTTRLSGRVPTQLLEVARQHPTEESSYVRCMYARILQCCERPALQPGRQSVEVKEDAVPHRLAALPVGTLLLAA